MLVGPPGRAEVEPPADVDEPHHAQDDGLDSSQGDNLWPPGRRWDPLCTGNISEIMSYLGHCTEILITLFC